MTFLSVIIPTYNEENRIGNSLTQIISYFDNQPYSYEIIVVDDGSHDNTVRIVESIHNNQYIDILKIPINKGKGNAVKRGMLASKGKLAMFTDADLSTPIGEIDKLLYWIKKGYNIVIGSRALSESNVFIRQKPYREFMGRTFNLIIRSLLIKGIKDTQCGFKIIHSDSVPYIFNRATIDGFSFDIELLYIAIKLGLNIKEVPVDWYNSPNSKVRIPWDPIKMFSDLIKIKIRHSYMK